MDRSRHQSRETVALKQHIISSPGHQPHEFVEADATVPVLIDFVDQLLQSTKETFIKAGNLKRGGQFFRILGIQHLLKFREYFVIKLSNTFLYFLYFYSCSVFMYAQTKIFMCEKI